MCTFVSSASNLPDSSSAQQYLRNSNKSVPTATVSFFDAKTLVCDIHTNSLKDLEFDNEASENICFKKATIANDQAVNRVKKSEAKPTSEKIDPLDCLSIVSTESNFSILNTPPEIIRVIFTYFTNVKDYASFAKTHKKILDISYNIPCNASLSDSMRIYLYAHRLFSYNSYKEASKELILSLSKRPLTRREFPISFPCFTASQKQSAELLRNQAKIAEEKFFNVFAKCCDEMLINKDHPEFVLHVAATNMILHHMAQSEAKSWPAFIMKTKVNSLTLDFASWVFNASIADYVDQPATSITIESFREITHKLANIFKENALPDIECPLRNALRSRHALAFEQLSSKLSDPQNPDAASLQAIVHSLMEAEIIAHQQYQKALAARDAANMELSLIFKNSHGYVPLYACLHAVESENKAVPGARENYLSKCNELDDAQKNRNNIKSDLTNMIHALKQLRENQKIMAVFYAELNREVRENNKVERHDQLHFIIKSFPI